MNKAIIIGRVTRDIEVKYNADLAICKFTLAVNRPGKKDEADFINCTAFGKTAESISKYTDKGKRLGVEGHIQTGSYTKQDGSKVYTTDVIVDRAEFIDFSEWDHKNTLSQRAPEPAPQRYQAPPQQYQAPPQYQQQSWQAPAMDDFVPIPDDLPDDGLPFGN